MHLQMLCVICEMNVCHKCVVIMTKKIFITINCLLTSDFRIMLKFDTYIEYNYVKYYFFSRWLWIKTNIICETMKLIMSIKY